MRKNKETEMWEDLQRYQEILKEERLSYEEEEFFVAGVKNLEQQLKQRGYFLAG